MTQIRVATIGFTKSNAEHFFERLLKAGVKRLIDVRLHNRSQLAGFAKANDLPYLLQKIGGIEYVYKDILAPTESMLSTYKKEKGDWNGYERSFMQLMEERQIERRLEPRMLEKACLLCSEAAPHNCHRRLVCEYLNDKWDGLLSVKHL